jgi:hypothetical protein
VRVYAFAHALIDVRRKVLSFLHSIRLKHRDDTLHRPDYSAQHGHVMQTTLRITAAVVVAGKVVEEKSQAPGGECQV